MKKIILLLLMIITLTQAAYANDYYSENFIEKPNLKYKAHEGKMYSDFRIDSGFFTNKYALEYAFSDNFLIFPTTSIMNGDMLESNIYIYNLGFKYMLIKNQDIKFSVIGNPMFDSNCNLFFMLPSFNSNTSNLKLLFSQNINNKITFYSNLKCYFYKDYNYSYEYTIDYKDQPEETIASTNPTSKKEKVIIDKQIENGVRYKINSKSEIKTKLNTNILNSNIINDKFDFVVAYKNDLIKNIKYISNIKYSYKYFKKEGIEHIRIPIENILEINFFSDFKIKGVLHTHTKIDWGNYFLLKSKKSLTKNLELSIGFGRWLNNNRSFLGNFKSWQLGIDYKF